MLSCGCLTLIRPTHSDEEGGRRAQGQEEVKRQRTGRDGERQQPLLKEGEQRQRVLLLCGLLPFLSLTHPQLQCTVTRSSRRQRWRWIWRRKKDVCCCEKDGPQSTKETTGPIDWIDGHRALGRLRFPLFDLLIFWVEWRPIAAELRTRCQGIRHTHPSLCPIPPPKKNPHRSHFPPWPAAAAAAAAAAMGRRGHPAAAWLGGGVHSRIRRGRRRRRRRRGLP